VRVVTLYGKADCHLCDDARSALERVRGDVAFELVERDIEDDERLLRAYFERIPVVTLDGRELFEFFVDEDALRGALAGPAPTGNHLESER
jgi:glutaredoxin